MVETISPSKDDEISENTTSKIHDLQSIVLRTIRKTLDRSEKESFNNESYYIHDKVTKELPSFRSLLSVAITIVMNQPLLSAESQKTTLISVRALLPALIDSVTTLLPLTLQYSLFFRFIRRLLFDRGLFEQ